MPAPAKPKIYHIVHVDRLPLIVSDGFIWSDAEVMKRGCAGTTIGMSRIKAHRLKELTLDCHPGLYVGSCAPFYFCPRSVMLYLIHKRNEELAYKGGQEPIVHLEADLYDVTDVGAKEQPPMGLYSLQRRSILFRISLRCSPSLAGDQLGCDHGEPGERSLEGRQASRVLGRAVLLLGALSSASASIRKASSGEHRTQCLAHRIVRGSKSERNWYY